MHNNLLHRVYSYRFKHLKTSWVIFLPVFDIDRSVRFGQITESSPTSNVFKVLEYLNRYKLVNYFIIKGFRVNFVTLKKLVSSL